MNPIDRDLRELELALKRNEFERAVDRAQAILIAAPGHIEATRLLGAGLRGCGRQTEARDLLSALAEREPGNALVHNSMGAVLRALGDIDGARAAFQRACELAPDLPQAWYNYAIVLSMLDETDAALKAIDRMIVLAPGYEQARVVRSEMLRKQGRVEQASAEYRAALARQPYSPWSWFGLSNLRNVPMSEADVEGLQRALEHHREAGDARTVLLFALAKALDDNERYAEAFAALGKANAYMHHQLDWDAGEFSAWLDAVLDAFSPPPRGSGVRQGREVIFIVSLPRSGSTLVEQILASHPQVAGGGERDDLKNVIEEENLRRGIPMTEWACATTPQEWQRLGQRYLEMTARARQGRAYLADKALANWRLVGPALAMLPDAKVIVCRRDPVETAFSCYRQHFSQHTQDYSYDFHDLAAYWRDFDRACNIWKMLHPGQVYDLVYEDLVADQEGKTRDLLAFCGLDFDPACLRFYMTQRKVENLSSAQVREPLRSDTARAEKYGALLDPLRAALGLPPLAAKGGASATG
ncbi:MAG TPA: sulfotransferase [Rudaea sp.]|jgi:tetratricopeptide (TPR) repeat protein|uniref:tetratricopeptide repeat-containing sulfotransferase family protein n=1 Tax=Rudaea sp. TaxID=2136325 RepID=UPI002F91CCC4